MKKNYLTIMMALLMLEGTYAQNPALPNAGFENWTQVGNRYDPNNWNTLNPSTAILGIFTATRAAGADVHSGSYAIKLQTKTVFTQKANGIASTGTIITTPPYGVVGGIPYTGRPDSIAGWYKYTPVGTDSGFVQFMLKDSLSPDTIGFIRWETHNLAVGTYTRFSAPIHYNSAAKPNLSCWILSSSRGSDPVVNSTLFIDDLALIFNPPSCKVPGNLGSKDITTTSAKLKWNAVTGALNYQQKYRVLGTTAWTFKTSTVANKVITGLQQGTTYEWAVQTKCASSPAVWSNWSNKKTFTTLSARESSLPLAETENEVYDLNLFPNPAHDVVNLEMTVERDELMKLSVYNAIGQLILKKDILVLDGTLNERINISSFNKGIYMITIDGFQVHSTKKLLVQ